MYKLLIVCFFGVLFSSCNGENEYFVTIVYRAKVDGILPRSVTSIFLNKYGIPIPVDSVLNILTLASENLVGGVGIEGTLIVNDTAVDFEPAFDSHLIAHGIKSIHLPANCIYSVKLSEPKTTLEKIVFWQKTYIIKTKFGDLKFASERKDRFTLNLFKQFDDRGAEISKKINKIIQQ